MEILVPIQSFIAMSQSIEVFGKYKSPSTHLINDVDQILTVKVNFFFYFFFQVSEDYNLLTFHQAKNQKKKKNQKDLWVCVPKYKDPTIPQSPHNAILKTMDEGS